MPGSVAAVVAELRRRGMTVHEWPGWQNRGNGDSADWCGGLVHHTGGSYSMAYALLADGRGGRDPLAGPLCNFAGNVDGTLTVIAAGVANHAGASGGKSMGPLPVTGRFNRRVMGLEICYPGDAPMRDAQYRAALVWARVVADVCGGGDIQRVRAHAETSVKGKWDPGYAEGKTIDMNKFRAEAAVAEGGDDMALDDVLGKRPDGVPFTVRDALANLYLGAFYGGGDSGARPVYKTVNAINDDLGKAHAQTGKTNGQLQVEQQKMLENLQKAVGDLQTSVASLAEKLK
ncbi:N-acetylmuramoyl-L-alanine amidase [Amycolatopsis suaedae]|uniref:N-acetylmuramoyl-L-alanine amidase n=1 Tax=Amycolatopsis suaedae TaxID=2510978 RepID=A0A4Q7J1U9_9PSEU|nr:N-acetylmuramoyl-L-alanine amidase [Amycolatopsis suaedae]RZQ60466.1 N-acetylmuramoyl-L-alanine amidase [Amycolatopsis suaedae]